MLQTQIGEITVTIDDACEIKASVEELLRTTKFADPVPPPKDPHVDSFGTMRFGAWSLERDLRDPEALELVYVIADTAVVRVRQEISIQRQEDGRWKAVSTGRAHYHRRY